MVKFKSKFYYNSIPFYNCYFTIFLFKCILLEKNVTNKSIDNYKSLENKGKEINFDKDIINQNLKIERNSKGKLNIEVKLIK